MESDRQEIFQQLCREEKQYSREGSLQDRIDGLPGSRLNLAATYIIFLSNFLPLITP
jgi:hypothetical protein